MSRVRGAAGGVVRFILKVEGVRAYVIRNVTRSIETKNKNEYRNKLISITLDLLHMILSQTKKNNRLSLSSPPLSLSSRVIVLYSIKPPLYKLHSH